MRPHLALTLSSAILALAGGCGDTMISISSDGRIEVSVTTGGTDVDVDGFSVTVDGGVAQFVAPGGRVTLSGLQPGRHSVFLSGLADNCQVVGANPRQVQVGGDGTVDVTFQVSCTRATTGGFTITVVTGGEPADSNGYLLAVAGGGELRPIGTSAVETFVGLTPGGHLVTLKDVDPGCTLVGGNPQLFTAVAGKTLQVRLTVSCAPPS